MASSANAFYSARILERRDISEDLWIIRVDPGGEFRFLPGQYATIGVALAEKHHERPYSIVSAPHEEFVEFFLELVPHGEVTPLLHSCRVGDELTLRKTAKGNFTFDVSSGRTNHLLLATVTGVCPFVSYIRSFREQWKAANNDGKHRLFLTEGASRSWELGYREELTQVAGEVPWLTYIPTVSRPWEDKAWTGETGRVDDLVRKYADSWGLTPDNTTVYLCGHPGMIENIGGIVQRRGWREDAIKKEAFFVPGHQDVASDD
jgi:ferredoxin/flavodoxin---NADP+ reductase